MLKITSNQREASKFCPVCEKEFPCGRALGGHMRVHTAQDSSLHNNGNGDEPPVCTVCRKVFHSWRSLYGHMRCHPERQWRGVLAPGKEEEVEGARNDSVESDRRVGSVIRWGVTGKRGRKGASATVESDVWEAAWNLMWMAGCSRSWIRGRYSVSSADFAVKSDMNSRNWFEFDNESELKSNGDSNGDDGFQLSLKQGKMKKRKSKTDSGLTGETGDPFIANGSRVDPNAAPGQSVFRCVTCQKEFTSYQALGGHRSKHYKERNPDQGAQNGPSGSGRLQWVGPKPIPRTGPVAWTGDRGAGWAMGQQEPTRMGQIKQPSNNVDGAYSVSYPLFC